jgi:peptide deformylase
MLFPTTNGVCAMNTTANSYKANILKVVHFGNQILYKKAKYVDNILSDNISHITKDMIETLKHADNGVGLAAPQVNIPLRIFVYRTDLEQPIEVVINPKIEVVDRAKESDWEGCLSLPNLVGLVPRYKKIKVTYQNIEGKLKSKILQGFEARVFQHETDHLNGIVYVQKIEDFAKFGFPEDLHLTSKE